MPDIIQLLPDNVANQIAAGEVVQRPASVVKELMENAIDAGADKIKLIIKDAGKSLVQVIDNGCGMSATDARQCVERHATSKIRRAEDLFAIRTMGFRGEAMASIAAIAHVEIKTRRHEDELGLRMEVAGSEINQLEPDAVPTGTSISVKNIFYNIPARRNFLKSNAAETKHIIDEFQRIALAHPHIHLSFHNDGNEIYHLPATTLKQRIVHVFGKHYNQRLVPIEEETSIIRVKGFIGKPEFARRTRGEQFFFVNNRFVRDGYLNHAILNAYQEVLPDDTHPLYVLFIDIDPSKIDINVHPTKTEIKFEDEKAIYAIIRSAVKRSLGRYNITPSLDFDQETGFSHLIQHKPLDEITPPGINFNPDFNPFREAPVSEHQRNSDGNKRMSGNGSPTNTDLRHQEVSPTAGVPGDWEALYEITLREEVKQLSLDETEEDPEPPENAIPKRLFQLHRRYIISQIHSGFVLIDQQAAHERVLYEQFMAQLKSKQGTSQQILFPQTITLQPADTALIQELLPELRALGFRLKEFGKNTFVVEGIPADLGPGIQEIALIEQLLEDSKNQRTDLQLSKREQLAKSLARNAAIKAGTELSPDEMAELIDKLFACESVNISIHGKPVILTFTLQELMARFN